MRAKRPGIRRFRVDDFGAPAYPELVLAVSRETLQDRPRVVRAAIAALARGYAEVLSDPESAISALLDATSGLARDGIEPRAARGHRRRSRPARASFGELEPRAAAGVGAWERRFGIVKRAPDVARAFDGRYVPASGKRD